MKKLLVALIVIVYTVLPAIGDIYYDMASKFYADEKHKKAQSYLKKSLKKNPQDIKARSLLADIYAAQNRYVESVMEYKKILKRVPENTRVLTGLATVYHKGTYYRDAVDTYKYILEIEPDNISALYQMGMNQALCMNLDKAYTIYRRLKIKDKKLAARLLHQIQGF